MFGKSRNIPDGDVADEAPARGGHGARTQHAPAAPASTDTVSSISSGMTLIGKLVGDGAVNVFGRIEGELHAATAFIHDGAEIDGNVVAQDLTIGGRVKGTVHAVRVKLLGTAVVEGDIFHRSLSIEENARFEGSSRREDDVVEARPSQPPRSGNLQPQAQPQHQLVGINGSSKFKAAADDELFQSAE